MWIVCRELCFTRQNLLLPIAPAYALPHVQREDMGCVPIVPFTRGEGHPFWHLPLQPLLHLPFAFLLCWLALLETPTGVFVPSASGGGTTWRKHATTHTTSEEDA